MITDKEIMDRLAGVLVRVKEEAGVAVTVMAFGHMSYTGEADIKFQVGPYDSKVEGYDLDAVTSEYIRRYNKSKVLLMKMLPAPEPAPAFDTDDDPLPF